MPLDARANRLRYLVLAIQAQGQRALDAALRRAGSGLTSTQSEVLEVLNEQQPLGQSELAARLVCTGGNITRLLDRMEAKGWLEREPDPADRRRTLVRTSPAGRAAYRAAEPVLDDLLRAVRAPFDDGELDELSERLERLATALGVDPGPRFPGAKEA